METRQATSEDLKQLIPFFNQYRAFYKQEPNHAAAANFISKKLQLKDSHMIMALNDAKVAKGFIQLYPSFSSVSMKAPFILNDLFVGENFRKKVLEKPY